MSGQFSLGDHYDAFIKAQVDSGRYDDASAVVRDALRLLEEGDVARQSRIDEIRRSIEEARRDGCYLTEDEVFGQLEARYQNLETPDRSDV